MGDMENEFEKKPRKKTGLVISLVIVVLIIATLILGYFLVFKSPKLIFSKIIDKVANIEEIEKFNTEKVGVELNFGVNADIENAEQINEFLKDSKINAQVQLDLKNKKGIVDFGLDYKNDNVIGEQIYYDDGEAYIYLKEIFDKYIELEMPNETVKNIEDMFNSLLDMQEKQKTTKKIIKIFSKELKNNISKEGEFSKESATLEIDGKDVKATKNILTLSEKQLTKVMKEVCASLRKNDNFLKCFEESPKEFLKALEEKMDKQLDSKSFSAQNKIIISIYTKGILNDIVGADFEMKSGDEVIGLYIVKHDKDEYSFKFSVPTGYSERQEIKGTLTIEKEVDKKDKKNGKISASLSIEKIELKLELKYNMELNKEIDKVKIVKSVKEDEITDADKEKMLENLSKRPIIEDIITNMMNMNSGIFNKAQSVIDSNIQLEADKEMLLPDVLTPDTNNITTSKNEVSNYDYKVSYTVPNGFEYDSEWSKDGYKYYNLGDVYQNGIEAQVEIAWDTEKDIEETINYIYNLEKEYSEDVSLSEIKTMKVNGKTFKYQTINYESYGIKESKTYLWYIIDNEYAFEIEFEAATMEITEDIMKNFLNINITKN